MLYLFLYCPILGRPTIVDVRIRSRIVRIHRTRRTIRVVRVVPKTERAASPRLCFNHAHGGFRGHSPDGVLVRCTWIFYLKLPSRQGSVCEKTDLNTFGGRFGRAIASHCVGLHPVAPASQENLGRPTTADVRNRSRTERKQRTRRAKRAVRVVPKTESRSLMHCKVASVAIVIEVYVTALAT